MKVKDSKGFKMGFFNLQPLIEGYKKGNLDQVIEEYDQNDLAIILKELKAYLEKNEAFEESEGLIQYIQSKIESMD